MLQRKSFCIGGYYMKKKNIIILCIIITLIIIAVAAYILYTSQLKTAARDMENSLNNGLNNANINKTESELFKCSVTGTNIIKDTIVCTNNKFSVGDEDFTFNVKDVEISITPKLKNAHYTAKGDMNVASMNNTSVVLNTKCDGSIDLINKKRLQISDNCSLTVDNISNLFSDNISVDLQSIEISNMKDLFVQLMNSDTSGKLLDDAKIAYKQLTFKLSSSSLFDDTVKLIHKIQRMTNSEIVSEEVLISAYNEMKGMANALLGEELSYDFVQDLINSIDKVIEERYNTIDFSLKLKDNVTVDDVNMNADSLSSMYDINISSSK